MKKMLLLLGIPAMCIMQLSAQWSADATVNNAICTAADIQEYPQVISDGKGGAIITWQDKRSTTHADIYAQRISATGDILWAAGGVGICTVSADQRAPVLVADGAGGAIIAWEDDYNGNSDIYAQRIDSTGAPLWNINGRVVCGTASAQNYLSIISDGAGGAILGWEDNNGTSSDIYVQRITSAGTVSWTSGGVPICTATGNQYTPKLAEDGSGGAIITWEDHRATGSDIYAQHISASGVVSGIANGLVICNASGFQFTPNLCSDGAGGAIITWSDQRNGNWDIYAQHVVSTGTMAWTANGIAINNAAGDQQYAEIVPDQNGGAYISWQTQSGDIYAQRVSSTGSLLWAAAGVAVCQAAGDQNTAQLISTADGFLAAWIDYRNNGSNSDVYAQRFNASGSPQWQADGVAICTQAALQNNAKLVSDNAGGAIVVWDDFRNGQRDVFAQNVCATGALGACPSSIPSNENSLEVKFHHENNWLSLQVENNNSPHTSLTILDVSGRRVLEQSKVNENRFEISTSIFSPGIYFLSLQSGPSVYTAKFLIK